MSVSFARSALGTRPEVSLFRSYCNAARGLGIYALVVSACGSRAAQEPVGVSLPKTPAVEAEPPAQDAGITREATNADGSVTDANVQTAPRLIELGYAIREHRAYARSWRQVQGLNWQAIAPPSTAITKAPQREGPSCEPGMVSIRGRHLLDPKGSDQTDRVESLQDATCTRWSVPKRICAEFSAAKWSETRATLPTQELAYCIDRFEYPNRAGEYPLAVVTYAEAEGYCKREGKRMCTETEWTFACEGEEGRPYPYGYERDSKACPVDRPRIEPEEDTFAPRTTHRTALGIDRMWQGEPSGKFAACISPFGVNDMTGNVDEWTRSIRTWGYRMILKGGHWSYVRGRCRPQTRGHGPRYVNVETGFRCCSDPRSAPAE
jgi:formylglycine-generating enzyme